MLGSGRVREALLSDEKPKWDMPANVASSKLDATCELAKNRHLNSDNDAILAYREIASLRTCAAWRHAVLLRLPI